eukprot:TRINITY_DN60840_c0_g1_i1.p1 TRINITY_DN60840_c0_g1~~TRINITY_DN60840_c0_g1_i1.p1  ORF type:complete len:382 (-),score=38.73 TRINITY_DN60840_c0_g1_i1:18-1136(-)
MEPHIPVQASDLHVLLVSGEVVPLQAESFLTIAHLRAACARSLQVVDARDVQLLVGERQLHNSDCLQDLSGSTEIHVVVQVTAPAVFVADHTNHRICRWSLSDGSAEIAFASSPEQPLDSPRAVCIDTDGSFLVADAKRGCVLRGRLGIQKCDVLQGFEQLSHPCSIAVDRRPGKHAIYVLERFAHRVLRMDRDGVKVTAGGNGEGDGLSELSYPGGICLDQNGALYVADTKNHRVVRWQPGASEGIVVAGGSREGSGADQLHHPMGVFVDSQMAVYIADTNNHRVIRWANDAKFGEVVAGGTGRGAGGGQIAGPAAVAVDEAGLLYVVENHNHRVTRWTPGIAIGQVVAGMGGLGAGLDQLNHPVALLLIS